MALSTEFTTRKFFLDNTSKNYLIIKQNNKMIIVSLKLEAYTKVRLIGHVTKSTKTIHIKRSRDKHLFIKYNAYGFNDYVLRNQTSFDFISLSDETCHWSKIPVSFVLENGKYLNFAKQGFELQRFTSLDELEPYKVKKEDNTRF
jgi:hypothetical protein